MAKGPAQPHPTLGTLLREPYEQLTARVYASLADEGFPDVRPAHSAVFRTIRPEGSRASQMAERSALTKQSMAYLVENMAHLGLVRLAPDPNDGRATLVMLTDRGFNAVQAIVRLSHEIEREWARALGETQWAELRTRLEALHSMLREG